MRYGSVCSGIEAATVAWHSLGWEAAWFSEIENFPSAVLSHHYPAVPNYGDMTKFEEWNLEPIDLLVGGTPCQSFSVAGLRKGLDDPRGNLMLTYGAIARRYRPRWLVWENVPGVLSSNRGADFGTFLGMLAELGYGFAYRILDAQYFGVAQRRRRVFVVGHLGSWRRAAAVLFESESLRGNPAPSREKRQDVAQCLTAGVGKRYDPETETLPVAFHANAQAAQLPTASRDTSISDSLTVSQQAAVAQPVAYGIPGNWIGRKPKNGGNAVEPMLDIAPCQTKTDVHAVAQPITQFGHVAGSLTARHDSSPCADRGQNVVAQPVAFEPGSIARNAGPSGESALAPTLRREMGDNQPAVRIDMQVRRLTPIECERLQGFPDNYTNIPWRKKDEAPDGPRYKALGNSMAVPVMRWIGERIKVVDNLSW